MTRRTPDAEEVSVVLVGSLNPGIFHPEWFRKQEILAPVEAEKAAIKIVSPEATEIQFLDMKLDVFSTRLVLETKDVSRAEKLQDVVVNILARLPHTPVTACGLNNAIQFDLNDESYWHKIGHTLAPKKLIWEPLLQNPGMATLMIKGQLTGSLAGDINVTVAPSTKFRHGLFVSSNYHFPVPQNDSATPHTERVTKFIQEMWRPALEMARSVAYRIFEQIKPEKS
jgi:hypothetical protein